jgi:hypothetical protein
VPGVDGTHEVPVGWRARVGAAPISHMNAVGGSASSLPRPNRATEYAQDWKKATGYLIIADLSGRQLELPTDGPWARGRPTWKLAVSASTSSRCVRCQLRPQANSKGLDRWRQSVASAAAPLQNADTTPAQLSDGPLRHAEYMPNFSHLTATGQVTASSACRLLDGCSAN